MQQLLHEFYFYESTFKSIIFVKEVFMMQHFELDPSVQVYLMNWPLTNIHSQTLWRNAEIMPVDVAERHQTLSIHMLTLFQQAKRKTPDLMQ